VELSTIATTDENRRDSKGKYHSTDGPFFPANSSGHRIWYFHGKAYSTSTLKEWPMPLYLGYIKWKKKYDRRPLS
jgi:hypothetical protein